MSVGYEVKEEIDRKKLQAEAKDLANETTKYIQRKIEKK